MVDQLPGEMGLPKGAPARPETPFQYPAVHDMPPPRATVPMNDEEQFKLEKELREVRDRQEAQEGKKGKKSQDSQAGTAKMTVPPSSKKAAPLAERQPSNAIVVPPAGVKTYP